MFIYGFGETNVCLFSGLFYIVSSLLQTVGKTLLISSDEKYTFYSGLV